MDDHYTDPVKALELVRQQLSHIIDLLASLGVFVDDVLKEQESADE
jgi:hypothetical protein